MKARVKVTIIFEYEADAEHYTSDYNDNIAPVDFADFSDRIQDYDGSDESIIDLLTTYDFEADLLIEEIKE